MEKKKKDLNKTKPKRLRDFIQWKVEATPPLSDPSNEKKVIVNTCVWRGGEWGAPVRRDGWMRGGNQEAAGRRGSRGGGGGGVALAV